MMFGLRLKALRDEANMSQKELGEKLGLGRVTISNYESGTKEPDVIRMLTRASEVFDVPVDYLLGLTDCRKKYTPAEPVKKAQVEELINNLPEEGIKAALEMLGSLGKKYQDK